VLEARVGQNPLVKHLTQTWAKKPPRVGLMGETGFISF
jgi:hypothetical protein